MLGKVLASGKGAGGLVRYITDTAKPGEEVAPDHELGAVEYRNLAATTPREASRDMALLAKLSNEEKPFAHFTVTWHPWERPTEAQMVEAMDRTLAKMGLAEKQAVYAIHREKAHLHIHAAVNRVGADGSVWNERGNFPRMMNAAREVARKMGFDTDQDHKRAQKAAPTATPKQQRVHERTGSEPDLRFQADAAARKATAKTFAAEIGEQARTSLRGATTWEQAHTALARHGLALREYASEKNPNRKGLEIVRLADYARCGASKLGSDYGRGALEKRLGSFRVDREIAPVLPPERVQRAAHGQTPVRPPRTRLEPVKRPDSPLWREYTEQRRLHADERAVAFARQRTAAQTMRADIRREAASDRAQRLRGLRGSAYKAERSLCAFRYASAREGVDATISAQRAQLRQRYRPQTWADFLHERAQRGDNDAVAQLTRLHANRKSPEMTFGLRQPDDGSARTTPLVRTLTELQAKVARNGDVTYSWRDGRRAFTDHGSQIALHEGRDRETIAASLRLAASKWGGTVHLQGGDKFKRMATEIATDLNINVDNMREYQAQLRDGRVLQRPAAQGLSPETPAHDRAGDPSRDISHANAPSDRSAETRSVALRGAREAVQPFGATFIGVRTVNGEQVAVVRDEHGGHHGFRDAAAFADIQPGATLQVGQRDDGAARIAHDRPRGGLNDLYHEAPQQEREKGFDFEL